MSRTITADAETLLAEVLDKLPPTDSHVTVEFGSRRVVILTEDLSKELFDKAREMAWAAVDRVQRHNAHLDPDEIYAMVTEEVEAVRAERRRESQAHAGGH